MSLAFTIGEWVLCVVGVCGELASSSCFHSGKVVAGKGLLVSPCDSDSRRPLGPDLSSAAGHVLLRLHWASFSAWSPDSVSPRRGAWQLWASLRMAWVQHEGLCVQA